MTKELNLVLTPKQASSKKFFATIVAKKLNIRPDEIKHIDIIKRSIDARSKKVKINLRVKIFINETPPLKEDFNFNFKNVSNKPPVIIVGAGPAGLFAALKLIEKGLKPIILERGKDIDSRKRDIALIHRNKDLNPDSNYAFGEGGAGTFSDGKLYTRSKKRGSIKEFLEILKFHGAKENILVEAHPHIGSDRLPSIIKNIRKTIIEYGGEVHFNTRIISLIIKSGKATGVKTFNGNSIDGIAVILATGHSARDIYYMLNKQQIALEPKAFAMGVRIEHPQQLIDNIQYSCPVRDKYLPAASYSLVQQVDERGVYSFCMCPGGVIVPASTSPNEMVVNGMSPSHRNTRWANSGMVVEIRLEDVKADNINPLKGLLFQQQFEQSAFKNGGNGQIAPAQRVVDFYNGKLSKTLPESSFRPGLQSSLLNEWIPDMISDRLKEGLKIFGNKMRGYFTNEAVLIGVESRTSSPVRIPRDRDTLEHIQIKGLYPCGEGAGYAGGIASSAIDGQNCAIAIFNKFTK